MWSIFAQLKRFIRLVRAVVEAVACRPCRNTHGSVLAHEHVLIVTISVAAELVGYVKAMRKIVAEPGLWYASNRVFALGHPCFIFALIATGWMFIVPVVTVGVTITP